MLLKFNRNYTSSNLTQSLEVDEKLILKTYGKTYEEIKAEIGVLFIVVKKGKNIVYVQKISGSEPVIKYTDKAFLNLPDEWYKFVCLKVCYASGATYEITSGEIDFNNEVISVVPSRPIEPDEPTPPSNNPDGDATPDIDWTETKDDNLSNGPKDPDEEIPVGGSN